MHKMSRNKRNGLTDTHTHTHTHTHNTCFNSDFIDLPFKS